MKKELELLVLPVQVLSSWQPDFLLTVYLQLTCSLHMILSTCLMPHRQQVSNLDIKLYL